MSGENNKSQNENRSRRFNQQQYELLKCCSDKKDMTEWNKWREDGQDVLLEGGDFSSWHLKGVDLGTNREYGRDTPEVCLGKAKFNGAHLEGANLDFAHIEGAELHETHLESAKLNFAYLDDAFLLAVHLEGASLRCAKLHNTNVCNAHLKWANLTDSELEGAKFDNADLRKCKFQISLVNGSTSFCRCVVDKETDFREVGLDSVRIDPATKQLLKYNIRRMNWEDWYKAGDLLTRIAKRLIVQPFWWMSNYGSSSLRIIGCFFGLAFGFAIIYRIWPGLVMVRGGADHLRDFIHALYFSVVTMTTLGFGDIAANPDSHCGQILLVMQVILGYGLLGALITRLAVLFKGEGPAGKFADEKKKEDTDNGND
jgi:uncharacterized protein YjbI with pentapeptide repeats